MQLLKFPHILIHHPKPNSCSWFVLIQLLQKAGGTTRWRRWRMSRWSLGLVEKVRCRTTSTAGSSSQPLVKAGTEWHKHLRGSEAFFSPYITVSSTEITCHKRFFPHSRHCDSIRDPGEDSRTWVTFMKSQFYSRFKPPSGAMATQPGCGSSTSTFTAHFTPELHHPGPPTQLLCCSPLDSKIQPKKNPWRGPGWWYGWNRWNLHAEGMEGSVLFETSQFSVIVLEIHCGQLGGGGFLQESSCTEKYSFREGNHEIFGR